MVDHPITETKHTLDGRAQSFACLALHLTRARAVVRFDHTAARTAGGYHLPAGSHTLGFFWRARHYNCYRFTGPDGRLIAYRFDVVDRVRIRPDHVSYRDLLLDVWRSPSGELAVEDEEEVAAALAGGTLTPAMARQVERTQRWLLHHSGAIVAEVEVITADLANGRAVAG